MKSVLIREQAKQHSIQLDKALWQIQSELGVNAYGLKKNLHTFLPELESQLTQNSQILNEQDQCQENSVCKLDQCPSRSLLTQTHIQEFDPELLKFFEGELADIRSRGVRMFWPHHITSIRQGDLNSKRNKTYSLLIDEWNTLGINIGDQSFWLGTPDRTINVSRIERNSSSFYKITLRNHVKRSSEIIINEHFDFLHLKKHAKAALSIQRSSFVKTIQNIRKQSHTPNTTINSETIQMEPKDAFKVEISTPQDYSSSESLDFDKEDGEFFINIVEDEIDDNCNVILDF